jgi:hypothetical protein
VLVQRFARLRAVVVIDRGHAYTCNQGRYAPQDEN